MSTKIPSQKTLKDCFAKALGHMPCKGRIHGFLPEAHPGDESFRKTMVDVFVKPFLDQPNEKRPLYLMGRTLMTSNKPLTLENAHRGTLGAHMAVHSVAMQGTPVGREERMILDKMRDPEIFEKMFTDLLKANRIKVRALSQ